MVMADHPGKFGFWHVACFALAAFTVGFVVRMGRYVIYKFIMTGQAGVVCLFIGEPVTAAGGVAMDAIEFAGFCALIHSPAGECIVFAEIPSVGIKIVILQGYEIIVVEIFLAGFKACSDRAHLGMTWAAHTVYLIAIKILCAYQSEVFWLFVFQGGFAEMPNVFAAGAVACFAVNSRFFPDGVVCVGFQVVVCRKLADVTAKAGSIERKRRFHPVNGLVAIVVEVPHGAGGRVEPLIFPNVISHRKNLKPASFQRGEKVINILAAQDVN